MEALNYRVVDMTGKEVGSIDLDPAVFGAAIDESLVQQTVRWQLAKRRAGTHSTLTRAEVRGGGRKPWRQKGRGTARSGSNTSPVWVGGGVSHGPKPRDYEFRLPKRIRRQALAAVLSDKVKNQHLIVLDDLHVASGKTRDMNGILAALGVKEEAQRRGLAIVMPQQDEGVWRSSSNLPRIVALPVAGVNVYDLVKARYLVSTRTGVAALTARLKGEQTAAEERSE